MEWQEVLKSDFLKVAKVKAVSGTGKSDGTFGNYEEKFSSHSYGAHSPRSWQPEIARLRVCRIVTSSMPPACLIYSCNDELWSVANCCPVWSADDLTTS
jgi:hypothetical protein